MAGLDFALRGSNGDLIKSLNDSMSATRKMRGEMEDAGKSIEDMFGRIQKAAAATVMGFSAQQLVKEVMDVRKEFQSLEVSFSTLLGSAEGGKKMFQDITDFATKTPMLEKDLAKAAQTMLGFNIESSKVMPLLQQLGDISMGDSQKFQSLALAFSQASSTGKLMGQDLLQMINAGFNPLVEIARTTGRSIADLKEDMSNGKISIEMLEGAFASATGEGGKFNGMLESMSHTLAGAQSNLEGAFQKLFNDIGVAIEKPIVEGTTAATDAVNFLAEHLEGIADAIEVIAVSYGTYKAASMALTAANKVMAVVEGEVAVQRALATASGVTATTQELREIAVSNLLTAAKMRLTAAMSTLNKVILANPYVAAATAIVTLAMAAYKVAQHFDDATEAAERLEKATEDYNTSVAKEQAEIDRLFNNLRKAVKEQKGLAEAKEAINSKYGSYLQNLQKEVRNLNDVEAAYRAVTKAAREAARARALESALSSAQDSYGSLYGTSSSNLYDALTQKFGKEKAKNYLASLRKELDETGTISEKTQKKIQNFFRGTANFGNSEAWIQGMRKATKDLAEATEKAEAAFAPAEEADSTSTPKQQDNKKYWEDKKKEAETELESLSLIEAKGARGAALKKKIQQYDQEIQAAYGTKTSTKEQNAAVRATKEAVQNAQALADADAKLTLQESRAKVDAILQARQYELNAMQDGSKKTIEQIKLDYEKEAEAIKRGIEDTIIAREQAEREIWERENPNASEKGLSWQNGGKNGRIFDLTDEERKMYENRAKANEEARNKAMKEANEQRLQIMRDYMQEYGSYEQKRAAISATYDKKISDTQDLVMRASLQRQKEKALSDLDFSRLQQNIDWETVFQNLDAVSTEYLTELRNKLKKALDTKDITAENAKVLVEKIAELENKIRERGSWAEAILPALRERRRLAAETAAAHERSVAAQKEQLEATAKQQMLQKQIADTLNQKGVNVNMADISDGSRAELLSKFTEDSEEFKTLTTLFDKLGVATTDVGEAADKASAAQSDYAVNLAKLDNLGGDGGFKAEDLFSWADGGFTEIVQGINSNVQSLADLTKTMGLGNTEFGRAVDEFAEGANAFSSVINDLASGDVFGAINHLMQGFQSWGSALGLSSNGNADEVAKREDELVRSNEQLISALDDLRNEIANNGGSKSLSAYMDAYKRQEEINRNQQERLRNKMDYQSAHHSNASYWNLSNEDYASINKTLADYAAKEGKKASVVSSLSDIYKLTPEEMDYVRKYNNNLWEAMKDQGKYDFGDYWEAVADEAGKLEELKKQLDEAFTRTSKEQLKSDFINSLMDMEKSAADFANDFTKMMQEAIINAKISDLMDEEIQKFYEDWASLSEDADGLTQSDLNLLRKQWDDIVQRGIQIRDEVADITGYDQTATQQGGTRKAFEGMSQDVADELNGRFTALQISNENIQANVQELSVQAQVIAQHLLNISNQGMQANSTLDSMLYQSVLQSQYLTDIAKYTKQMYEQFGTKIDNLSRQLR